MSRLHLILLAALVFGLGAPDLAAAQSAEDACAPKRKRKRRKKKKKKPPPEPIVNDDDEIDELSEKDPEDPLLAGQEPEAPPEPWQVGVGGGLAVGFYYSHINALERTLSSSAPLGGLRGHVDLAKDGIRWGAALSFSLTGAPSFSANGSSAGDASEGLSLLTTQATFDVDDVWRELSVGGGIGAITIFHPLRESASVGPRFTARGRWGLKPWLGVTGELGFSSITEATLAKGAPFRGPVIDFQLALEFRAEEVSQW